MRRILLLSLLCLGLASSSWAQIVVKGRVTSLENPNEGLPGVNVVIKGTSNGTSTGLEGDYTLQVPDKGAVLVFSFIGMTPKEVTVGNQTRIDVQLASDGMQLSEVVVVGYGTQKRKDVTSSITQLGGDDVSDVPGAYSFDGAIQGKAAGVNISTPSATPGAAVNVNIRGVSSIGASSQPLYVIDGIPVVARNNSALNSNIQPMNPLAEINPSDIESISVLKDASAAAIYGSRGANGVIIIKTKRGQTGKAKVKIGYYTGISEIANTPELMNARQWIEFYNTAAEFDGLGPDFWTGRLGDPNDPNLQTYNAYDAIFRTGTTNNIDFSVQGGNENTKYFASANYFKQDGLQKGLGFERMSARLNMDNSITDRLGVGTSMTVSRTNHDRTINENDEYGVVINAQAWDPTAPLIDSDGTYTNPFNYNGWWALENPLVVAEEYVNTGQTTRVLGSAFATYDLSDKFVLKTSWSIDYNSLVEESFVPAGYNQTPIGEGVYATYDETAWIGETTLSYNESLGGKSTLNLLLGHTLQESYTNFGEVEGQGFPVNQKYKISTAANTTGSGASTSFGFQSFFGRANLNLAGKYLINLSVRADGSSRFGEDNRYGVFPSGSIGWRMSEEPFMEFAKPVVSNLKLRASYGITGNAEIGNFGSLNVYSLAAGYNATPGSAPSSFGNPNLSWEKTAQLNIGINLGFFQERLSITGDYFVKNTTELLLDRDIPGVTGFGSITDNFGEIRNEGVELAINAELVSTGDFTWNASFNYTHVENEVVDVLNDGQIISRNFVIREGMPLSQLNLIRFLGVDPLTGDAKFEDLNGDGIINLDDRQPVGSGIPTDFAGLTNTFSYRGLTLEVFFQYSGGNKIFNQSRYAYENYGSLQSGIPFGNQAVRSLDHWKQPGDITDIPRPSLVTANDTDAQYQRFSTQYLEDGEFLRLKNVKLAYQFPPSVTEKLKVSSLRMYVQGRNLITWTNYLGFDPEVSTNTSSQGDLNAQQGEDFGTLGQARTFTIGVNVGL